jgi:hypothetical protein
MFIADMLIRPNTKKFGKCFVFKGKQGTGKTGFWEWIGHKVIGKKYYHKSSNIKDYCGDFAEGNFQKILCILEEANATDGFNNADKLKDMITSNTTRYEQKYKSAITTKHLCRYVLITNNNTPAKVEQSDRRYEPYKVSDEKKGDDKYWNFIHETVFKHEPTIRSFVEWIIKLDVKSYRWKEHDNKIKTDMSSSTIPMICNFLHWLCDEDNQEYLPKKITVNRLHQTYNEYRNISGEQVLKPTKFGKMVRAYLDDAGMKELYFRGSGNKLTFQFNFITMISDLTNRYNF